MSSSRRKPQTPTMAPTRRQREQPHEPLPADVLRLRPFSYAEPIPTATPRPPNPSHLDWRGHQGWAIAPDPLAGFEKRSATPPPAPQGLDRAATSGSRTS